MSFSLMLRGGDLVPSGSQMALVSGPQKVVQDMRCTLLEPRGTDPLHPEFGSTLNGGLDELGQTKQGVIGQMNNQAQLLEIESEIRRVVNGYILDQTAKLYEQVTQFNGQHTFSPGEIITELQAVEITQVQDVVVAMVKLITSTGQTIEIVRPVRAENGG